MNIHAYISLRKDIALSAFFLQVTWSPLIVIYAKQVATRSVTDDAAKVSKRDICREVHALGTIHAIP